MRCLRFTNLINAGACVAVGVYGVLEYFVNINDGDNEDWEFAGIFLSLYAIAFALFLCAFEAGRMGKDFLTDNFGFMYNFCGRASFLLFVAILLFDDSTFGTPGLLVGIFTCLNAFWQVFILQVGRSFV